MVGDMEVHCAVRQCEDREPLLKGRIRGSGTMKTEGADKETMDEQQAVNGTQKEEKSFEELLEENMGGTQRLKPGQKITAEIVNITDEWVFIDLGGKSEGTLAKSELLDEHGELTVAEGATVEAYFLSSRNNELLFTTRIESREAGLSYLEDAWRNGIPVEGIVEKEIKGGYDVKIAGSLRGFCPHSQMGIRRQDDNEYVGKHLTFKITEYAEKGRNIVLSHRAIREEELRKKREVLKEILQEGQRVTGIITSIQKFGAFLDIDGAQGLIPISEISWGQVDDIKEILSNGQEIEVVIMKLDWEHDRLSFSIKQTLPNPWERVDEKYAVGSRYMGKVARLTKFGAFVTLEGGIDGLIHISKLGEGKSINHPSEVLETGQDIEVEIETIDTDQKRIALVTAHYADAKNSEEKDDYQSYMGKTSTSMGTLGDLLKKSELTKRLKK